MTFNETTTAPRLKLITERREVGQVYVMQSKRNKGAPGEGVDGHSVLGVMVEDVSYLGFRILDDLSDEAADYRLFSADENGVLQSRGLVWKITAEVDKKVNRPVTTLYIQIEVDESEVEAETEVEVEVPVVKTDEEIAAEQAEAAARTAKAIERIKKLIALATNPNKHEGNSAGAKAQLLMQKYRLVVEATGEVVPEPEAETEADDSLTSVNRVSKNYRYYVATEKKAASRAEPGKGMLSSKVPAFSVYERKFMTEDDAAVAESEARTLISESLGPGADDSSTSVDKTTESAQGKTEETQSPKSGDSSKSSKSEQKAAQKQENDGSIFGVDADNEGVKMVNEIWKHQMGR